MGEVFENMEESNGVKSFRSKVGPVELAGFQGDAGDACCTFGRTAFEFGTVEFVIAVSPQEFEKAAVAAANVEYGAVTGQLSAQVSGAAQAEKVEDFFHGRAELLIAFSIVIISISALQGCLVGQRGKKISTAVIALPDRISVSEDIAGRVENTAVSAAAEDAGIAGGHGFRLSKILKRASPRRCSRYEHEVFNTPIPYITLCVKLMEEASGKYFVGQVTSAIA